MNTNDSLQLSNIRGGGTPLISIVIPAYNATDFIGEALETIFRQPLNSDLFEVLVINDGSTDDTVEKVNRFKHKSNLRLFDINNGGTGHARNIGIKESKGDFIIFLDADDLFLPHSLNEKFLSALKDTFNRGTDIICTPKFVCDMDLQNEIDVYYPQKVNKVRNHMPLIEFWSCIYRREYLINKKVYFFEYKEQDIETAFRYRAFSRTDNIVINNQMGFYLHRDNPSSNVHTWKPLTMNYIKFRVYTELINEAEKKLIKRDGGYLKYILFTSLYEFFSYININGFGKNNREQVEYMCAQIKQFKFSFKEWLSLSARNKIVYIKWIVKIRKISCFDFVIKLEKEEKRDFENEYKREKPIISSASIIERWSNLK